MNYLEVFRDIRTFIFDVDGVMTNSEIIVLENGHLLRKMNIRDGYAIKLGIKRGYRVAVITGGKSSGVIQRLRALGVIDIYSGVSNKLDAFEEYLYTYDLSVSDCAYMGDDLPDLGAISAAGLGMTVADGCEALQRAADWSSLYAGGCGAVREACEYILTAKGVWATLEADFS